MNVLDTIISTSRSLLPLVITVFVVIFLVLIIRYFLKKRWQENSDMQFHFQFSMLALGFAGGLAVILSLPISDTLRGQLLGLIGILLSAAIALSSTTFIGNILAGIMLRVVGNLRMGSFVMIQDMNGRVSEMGLLHIEIQTEDRDLVTIPNLVAATQAVKVARSSGTIVSAEVSIGYDASRLKISHLLQQAASNTGLEDGFVQVRELGDFSITYRVAGLLKDINGLLSARSKLREAVLDSLHEANIEIVSPNFMNTRAIDPKQLFIPIHQKPKQDNKNIPNPEELIFDKADAAASVDSLRKMIDDIESEFNEHKEGKLRLSENQLNQLNTRKQNLFEALQAAEKQHKLAENED